jgi:beta-glucosidase-like glycosyl hydrolase
MVPFAYTEFIDGLTTKVQNNIIPMSRIDDAVYRILRVKFTMGLFENPYADQSLAGELGKKVSSKFSETSFIRILENLLISPFSFFRNTENLLGKPLGNHWFC